MAPNYGPKIVKDGLVLCLDAANPRSYPGSGNTWSDLSKNRHSGTLTNGPLYSSNNNGVITFDGSNDYVELSLLTETFTEVTISTWFKTGVNHIGAILAWGDLGTVNWGCLGIGPFTSTYSNEYIAYIGNAGDFSFFARDYETSNSYLLSDNKFHNITVTVTSGLDKIYLDGLSVPFSYRKGSSANNDFLNNSVTNFRVGRSTYNGGHIPFNGDIANVSVYNRALLETEVKQNYNALKGRYGL